MRHVRTALQLVTVLALVVVAAPPAAAAASKPAPTEIGVSASEIRIAVIADVENSAEPGLHQANVDAVRAFAADVNAHGGLAGRHLVVDFYDSHLSASDTQNAIIQACQKDFAMVGTGASFVNDTSQLVSCPDQRGRATGLPDLSTFALDVAYACSPVSFQVAPSPLECATAGQSPQRYRVQVGPARYFLRQHPGLHGQYVLSGDLKSVRDAAQPLVNAWTQTGIRQDGDGTNFISSLAPRSGLTPIVQSLASNQSSFVYAGVPVNEVAALRAEANAQNVQSVKLWTCPFSCYDRTLLQAGPDVDGELVTSTTVPFEEAQAVPALARYLRAVGAAKATGFGVQAWIAGLLFRTVVETLARTGGPNALTRSAFLAGIRGVRSFTADGILGSTDIGGHRPSDCFLVLQVKGGRFARNYPKTTGAFDCRPANTRTITLDLPCQHHDRPGGKPMGRVQLALNVEDLDAAIDFYSRLFGTEPAKIRDGYANFAITDPPLKLVLVAGYGKPGTLNHLGVEVQSTDEVDAAKRRLADEGLDTKVEDQTDCCYATQDKVWVSDPGGAWWEIYTILADSEVFDPRDAEATSRP